MLKLFRTLIFSLLCTALLFACSHSAKHTEKEDLTHKNENPSYKVEKKNLPRKTKRNTHTGKGYKIAQLAKSLEGSPYRYGGNSPKQGFDCSGLVHYTHNKFGIHVPRTSLQQFNAAKSISRKKLQSGDLVFFKLNKKKVSHVGIYIGNGQFIHAPESGKVVSTSKLNEPYWQARIAGSGRLY